MLYAPREQIHHHTGLHSIIVLISLVLLVLLAVFGGPWPRVSTSS